MISLQRDIWESSYRYCFLFAGKGEGGWLKSLLTNTCRKNVCSLAWDGLLTERSLGEFFFARRGEGGGKIPKRLLRNSCWKNVCRLAWDGLLTERSLGEFFFLPEEVRGVEKVCLGTPAGKMFAG